MTLLLFDLDDTLLGNEMNNFIPAYVQALAQRMSEVADPSTLIKTLMSATRRMIENPRPDQTLEEKFDEAFYPPLGLIRQEVQGIIDTFYQEDFPKLRSLTQFRPQAVSVVDQLLERGDQAAIATNPLFPRTAIQQRLSWAGFPLDKYPFAIVPSYETFHFAKPNPAYFAEFLAQLGYPKTPVVMVGNDVESDIWAARQLGLPVFWMNNDGKGNWNGQGEIPPHGELIDLLPWLDKVQLTPYKIDMTSINALRSILRSTPAALATLCKQNEDNLGKQPNPGEWSAGEVLCHLRDVDAEVNLPRLRKVTSEINPFIAGEDTDPWAKVRKYYQQDGMQALKAFIRSRVEVIQILDDLSVEDWKRPARHAIFGPTNLQELVKIICEHDMLHVQQLYKALFS